MIEIIQGPVTAKIRGAPPEALAALSVALTFEVKGAQYMKVVQQGRWDGKTRLLNRVTGVFPAGLAGRMADKLRETGQMVRVLLADKSIQAAGKVWSPFLRGIELHPHQREAVEKALTLSRAIVQSPTGSGKTEIGAELVRRLGLPTLWLVNKQDLLTQTAERLRERLGVRVGMIGAGYWNDADRVVVGMVQTLTKAKAPEWWEQWRVLVLDECHHGSADSWYDLAGRCHAAPWRFGLSATPLTGDPLRDAKLEGATGPLIVVRTIDELVKAGFLAKPRIVMLRPPAESYPTYEAVRAAVLPDWRANPIRLRKMGGKLYAEAYRRGVTENRERTNLIAQQAVTHVLAGEKVLILCTLLDHGKAITDAVVSWQGRERVRVDATGRMILPVWWLDGSDKLEDRKAVLAKFKAQRGGAVIVASTIFQEGVDLPELDVLILAGGGKSDLTTLQRVGRALRRRPDKDSVLIYDCHDGRGTWAPKDYLAQHTAERLATYKAQGFEVTGVES